MKKICTIFIILLITFFIIKLFNNYNLNKLLNEYDYIIVGTNCSCRSWAEGCTKETFGIKNESIKKLNEQFKVNRDNIFYPSHSYYDNKNHYEISKSVGENGQDIFNNIVNIFEEKASNYHSIISFIVTKNNYYIHAYEDDKYVIYKYIKEDNSLQVLMNIDYCDISYFYEK